MKIELHSDKSKIIELGNSVNLLGYRIFYHHKLLRKSNKRKFYRKFNEKLKLYCQGVLKYEDFTNSLQGWFGYSMWANTYKLRNKIIEILTIP